MLVIENILSTTYIYDIRERGVIYTFNGTDDLSAYQFVCYWQHNPMEAKFVYATYKGVKHYDNGYGMSC